MEKFWQKNKDLKKESDIPLLASQNNWACCAWCTWVKVGDTKEVSEEALGRHVRRCSGKPKSRVGTKAEQAVEHMMQEEHQASLPKVEMDGATLFNLLIFKYLGHHTSAHGCMVHNLKIRQAIAKEAFWKLARIWEDQQLRGLEGLELKIRLYRSGVVSKLTHCHEVWKLDTACIATLELFNACCLQAMTGRTYREETVEPTFDLIAWLRSLRLRWLGHILRMDEEEPLRQMVVRLKKPYPPGSLLMDAPQHTTMADLIALAGDHANHEDWDIKVNAVEEIVADERKGRHKPPPSVHPMALRQRR
jgi:hypothetical protein